MTRAGTPATMLYGGTSFVTTAPAATTLCAPMVTPSHTDDVGADPDVVLDDDALLGEALHPDRHVEPVEVVVEPVQRGVRRDAHPVADHDLPGHGDVRVQRAVGADRDPVAELAAGGDVAAVADGRAPRRGSRRSRATNARSPNVAPMRSRRRVEPLGLARPRPRLGPDRVPGLVLDLRVVDPLVPDLHPAPRFAPGRPGAAYESRTSDSGAGPPRTQNETCPPRRADRSRPEPAPCSGRSRCRPSTAAGA